MKNKIYIAILVILGLSFQMAQAQFAHFPAEGTITYDKTVHIKNLLKRHIESLKDGDFSKQYFEQLMTKVPETAVLQKQLAFKGTEVSFTPVQKEQNQIVSQLLKMGILDYETKMYQNLATDESTMVFEIGGSNIAIKDKLTNVKWKITNEYRNIAGYDCRRANGVTLDSVYVVAFFTDQIPTSAGPGTIHGLPGMIMGLVVPEQHFNIYASKVELSAPTITKEIFKKKDSPTTRDQTKTRMKEILGQWMSDKQFNLIMAAMFL